MNNQVIKVLTIDHGIKVIDYLKSRGVDTDRHSGGCSEDNGYSCIYYGVINDEFSNYSISKVIHNNAEIIELPTEHIYPKVMLVWDRDKDYQVKRVVFMERCGKYLAWQYSETIEDSLNEYLVHAWDNAEDIQEEVIVELTLEDISAGKGVGVPVHLLRIKK